MSWQPFKEELCPAGVLTWGATFGAIPTLEGEASIALAQAELIASLSEELEFADELAAEGVVEGVLNPIWGLDAEGSVGTVQYETGDFPAAQDTWVPLVALCPDDNNKDGTDLQIDSNTATRKDAYIQFDLTGFDSGLTLLGASFTIKPKAAILANDVQLWEINSGDEGWNETTLKCSDPPPLVTLATITFNVPTAAADVVVDLSVNGFAMAYLQARLGAKATFVMRDVTALPGDRTFESKDEGTDDASGPRLSLILRT